MMKEKSNKKVKEIMTEEPVCCQETTEIEEIAGLMRENNCGEIPVVDSENRPLGVVTDRDIVCRIIANGNNPLLMTARDCMTSPCITVTPETTLEECCQVLEDNQIRRVVVVNDGRCCGIVSQADIALKAPKEKAAEVLQQVSKAA